MRLMVLSGDCKLAFVAMVFCHMYAFLIVSVSYVMVASTGARVFVMFRLDTRRRLRVSDLAHFLEVLYPFIVTLIPSHVSSPRVMLHRRCKS